MNALNEVVLPRIATTVYVTIRSAVATATCLLSADEKSFFQDFVLADMNGYGSIVISICYLQNYCAHFEMRVKWD